ncbi:MAG: SRPBCC family protein [Dehalococcoidia bacterium]
MTRPGDGAATKTRSAFSASCAVSIRIAAPPERVWELLTDAAAFPRWNSTVTSIDGSIRPGETLSIRVPISERTFKVSVTTFDPPKTMVWSDGRAPMFTGVRTYTLSPNGDATTTFAMREVFSGLMLPLIARTLPDFKPVFEQYALDLKNEAERT